MLEYTFDNTLDVKKIKSLADRCGSVLVGFPGGRMHVDATHDEETGKGGNAVTKETAELAKELHFGTATIPARPFLDDGIRNGAVEITAVIGKELEKTQPNLSRIGTVAVGKVQEFVRSDYYKSSVPNSDETIKIKGSDTPLIDGGDLINSLTFVVED